MKTITMTELREEPREHIREVHRQGQRFLLTKAGKPVAKLVPVDEVTVIERDGTIRGEMPLTMRLRADAGY